MSSVVFSYDQDIQLEDIYSVQDSLTPGQLIEVDYSNASLIGSNLSETILLTFNYIQGAYNNTNLYTITPDYIGNSITVQANNNFSFFSSGENNTGGRVLIGINNTPIPSTFFIDSVTTSEADSDPCNNVKLTITTNPQASNITTPIVDVVTTNPYVVDVQRTGNIIITMNDSDNNTDIETIFVPALFAADFSADVVNSPSLGTVTITNNYNSAPNFTLEYSLDNQNWFLTNSFSGLEIGNHTAYVRDGIGCSISLDFEISTFSPTVDPRIEYIFISNSGSFRFVEQIDFNNNIKIVNNTLSYQERADNNDRYYKQPYQNSDGLVTQQIKTSYENINTFLIDCQGTEINLPVSKKSQNIGIEDVRDGRIITSTYLNQQYVSIQFGSGNTYDPTTLEVNGSYALGNELPSWIDINEYLNIQNSGWLKVIDIVRIDGVNTAIMNSLVSNYSEAIPQQGLSRRITSIYNQLDYEVYEFNVDMANLSGDYYMRIDFTDSEFESKSYPSEWINVSETQERTHYFEWYNTINNEINYSTGIVNKARFRYIYDAQWLPNDDQETFVANTDTIQIESTVRNYYLYKLYPIPTGINQKFNLLCANDRILADGLTVVRETEPEVIHYNSTNLYQINQQLTEAGYKFDNRRSDGSIDSECGIPLGIEDLGNGLLLIED